jgi:NhaA family Na+:H+ antiporter
MHLPVPATTAKSQPPAPRERPVQRWLRPVVRFLRREASGGIVLMVCTVIALFMANSRWAKAYADFFHAKVGITIGRFSLVNPLEWWINDGLMTVFFFVVGLEIKRELVRGELRDPRKAALPAAAALGGMLVPAGIYLLFPRGGQGARGWGVPMATDIAFVVGFLALLGRRVPFGLKILLLSLAIVDDLGAVLVIAVAYTEQVGLDFLAWAGTLLAVVAVLRVIGVRFIPVYVALGVLIWYAVYRSGVHPTVAGVLLGMLTPSSEWVGRQRLLWVMEFVSRKLRGDEPADDKHGRSDVVNELLETARETVSPLDRLETTLHPWVAYGIMPVFALANAGVPIDPALVTNRVALAVAAGLVVGKPVGIVLFSLLAVRLNLARLPSGVNRKVLLGGGCLAGVGFTMSLFIANLGLKGPLLDAGKVGTLTGSLLSALLGLGLLAVFLRRREKQPKPVSA